MKKTILFAIVALAVLVSCGEPTNSFFPDVKKKSEKDSEKTTKDKDKQKSVTYTIEIDVLGKASGDSITWTPQKAKAGQQITLNYTVAKTKTFNHLVFSGITVALDPVNAEGSGTRKYTVNADDASAKNKIVIIAEFIHDEQYIENPQPTVTYTIDVQMYGNETGDSVTWTPKTPQKGGTQITVNYNVANTRHYNQLVFSDIIVPLNTVNEAGTGTQKYTINADDASEDNIIVITATFTHDDKEILNVLKFEDDITHKKVIYGDSEFTNAIDTTGLSATPIIYSSSDPAVATVNSSGVVTILRAGETNIIAHKEADETYSYAPVNYLLEVDHRPVTITFTVAPKTYDGNINAYLNSAPVVNGVLPGDIVTHKLGGLIFENRSAGNSKRVVCDSWGIEGRDAGNYRLSAQPAPHADIYQKPVNPIISVTDKVYDGYANVPWEYQINDFIVGDNVDFMGYPVFENKNVGENKSVTFNDWHLEGAEETNYRLAAPPVFTATVTKKSLSLSIPAGTTLTPLSGSNTVTVTFTGLVAVDTPSMNVTNTNFTFNASSRVLTFANGPANIGYPNTNATLSHNMSNYTDASISLTVYDGRADYNGAAGTYDRRIPVTSSNRSSFQSYASSSGASLSYKLTENITLTGTNNWTPITNSFCIFDGQGHTITGLNINNPTADDQGLFARGGYIKNLGLVNVSVSGRDRVGAFSGTETSLEKCYVAGGTVSGRSWVGGIIGYLTSNMRDCYSTVNVTGTGNYVGGLTGWDSLDITRAYATGTVVGAGYVGGLVGYNWDVLQYSVALNPSVRNTLNNTNVGRVGGEPLEEYPLTSNYARGDMVVQYNWNGSTGINKTINAGLKTIDGQSVNSGTGTGQYNTQAFWTSINTGWNLTATTSAWQWSTTKQLPILRGIEGQ